MIILPFGIVSDMDHTATEDIVQALNIFLLISVFLWQTTMWEWVWNLITQQNGCMMAAGFCIHNLNTCCFLSL